MPLPLLLAKQPDTEFSIDRLHSEKDVQSDSVLVVDEVVILDDSDRQVLVGFAGFEVRTVRHFQGDHN